MAERRVVLTGLGTVNPLTRSVAGFWDSLLACKTGISRIERFDPTPYTSQIGGEVKKWDRVVSDLVASKESKRMDRYAQFAVQAATEAVADSGLDFDREDVNRCAVIVGTGIGGLQELETQHCRMLSKGPSRVSPFTVPKLMGNAASGHIAILWGLHGVNFAVVTACASASNAIGEAYKVMIRDEADIAITGGSEAALTTIGLASFCSLKALSTRNDEPQRASRPFDKDRDGFLLSEGAGIIVLEELQHAKARGAEIYAELVGYGASCDGYHITAPDPEGNGAILAMRRCIEDARADISDVDYINAHGTSTQLGDIAEVRAVKRLFGHYATGDLLVSSTKSATGHLLGASGGVEVIVSVLVIRNGVIPPTLNLENPDDECDLDFCALQPRETTVNTVMSNSFGFGGHNACLMIRKFEG
ncbi:MAG: beta-ketoacyl-ACP synthase II [Phycisphaerae bacterium]|jgi:3-oxoacyl-[acyl-carrier-protein] synthase II|nr:beta-ketoacyl-ACP synthase II [Phycisphaerae bacterium]